MNTTPERPLGLLEKYQLSKHLVNCYGNITLIMILEHPSCEPEAFHDHITPALTRVINQHPYLSIVVRNITDNKAHFERLSQIDLDKVIQICPGLGLQEMIQQQVSVEFDLKSLLPLWRLCIVPISLTESMFAFTTHHIISDGIGLTVFWKAFLQEIGNFAPIHNHVVQVQLDSKLPVPYELSGAPTLSLLNDVVPVLAKSVLPKLLPSFVSDWMNPVRTHGWQGDSPAIEGEHHDSLIRSIHVPQTVWKPILDEAKKRQLTGHAILAATCLLTWAHLYPDQITEFGTPVNTRSFCQPPVVNQMGNYVGSFTSHWKASELITADPWKIAVDYHHKLKAHKLSAAKETLFLQFLPDFPSSFDDFWHDKRQQSRMGRTGGLELSDLARLDLVMHDWRPKQVYFCQSAQTYTSALNINTVSFDGQLTCTLSWQKGALEEAKMEHYHDVFLGILKTMK